MSSNECLDIVVMRGKVFSIELDDEFCFCSEIGSMKIVDETYQGLMRKIYEYLNLVETIEEDN